MVEFQSKNRFDILISWTKETVTFAYLHPGAFLDQLAVGALSDEMCVQLQCKGMGDQKLQMRSFVSFEKGDRGLRTRQLPRYSTCLPVQLKSSEDRLKLLDTRRSLSKIERERRT